MWIFALTLQHNKQSEIFNPPLHLVRTCLADDIEGPVWKHLMVMFWAHDENVVMQYGHLPTNWPAVYANINAYYS